MAELKKRFLRAFRHDENGKRTEESKSIIAFKIIGEQNSLLGDV